MRISIRTTVVLLVALNVVFGISAFAQEPEPGGGGGRNRGGPQRGASGTHDFLGLGAAPDPAQAKLGEPLYKQNCGGCHGETGRGAQGPNLVRSVVVLHDEKDEQIGPVVKNGRPQGGMPAFPQLSDAEIHSIAQYLKMQIELAANRGTYGQTYSDLTNKITGDPKQGEAFFKANCASCHSATGDLANVGGKFTQVSQLAQRFLWPSTPGPANAKVTLSSGETIAGKVRREDDFNISLVDGTGETHTWAKDSVKVEIEDKLQGHRALLPKYSDADIHNVTAYLATLKSNAN